MNKEERWKSLVLFIHDESWQGGNGEWFHCEVMDYSHKLNRL